MRKRRIRRKRRWWRKWSKWGKWRKWGKRRKWRKWRKRRKICKTCKATTTAWAPQALRLLFARTSAADYPMMSILTQLIWLLVFWFITWRQPCGATSIFDGFIIFLILTNTTYIFVFSNCTGKFVLFDDDFCN